MRSICVLFDTEGRCSVNTQEQKCNNSIGHLLFLKAVKLTTVHGIILVASHRDLSACTCCLWGINHDLQLSTHILLIISTPPVCQLCAHVCNYDGDKNKLSVFEYCFGWFMSDPAHFKNVKKVINQQTQQQKTSGRLNADMFWREELSGWGGGWGRPCKQVVVSRLRNKVTLHFKS